MPCFCEEPAAQLSNAMDLGGGIAFPMAPPAMQLAVALPAMDPITREDHQIAMALGTFEMPNMQFGAGGMMDIAMSLQMMPSTFSLNAPLPQLEFEMNQAAQSIEQLMWPQLSGLASISMQPLLNYAIVARLVLDLQAMDIDPFDIEGTDVTRPDQSAPQNMVWALTRPQLMRARFMAGIPPLMQLSETMELPPLGEPGAVDALSNRLDGMASLSPPSLSIPMPMLQKLGFVMQSIATIQEAFGSDALTAGGMQRVQTNLGFWWARPVMPWAHNALALQMKLDALPKLEDVQMGEDIAGSASSTMMADFGFSPPKIAIMPFMNIAVALAGSMQLALNMDTPPLDMCSMCPCA